MTTENLVCESPPGKRCMKLTVSVELLVEMCKPKPEGYWWKCDKHMLPRDAKVVSIQYDPPINAMVIILESKEWPERMENNHLMEVEAPRFITYTPPPEYNVR